jgi:hypothetical protein
VDSRVITLKPVVHHRMALQLLIVIIHKLWHLNLVPPHVLPQKLHPVHIFQLLVQPAVCMIRALKDVRESLSTASHQKVKVRESYPPVKIERPKVARKSLACSLGGIFVILHQVKLQKCPCIKDRLLFSLNWRESWSDIKELGVQVASFLGP